ncbi:hypothetical protein BCR42DRAFT_403767 [Absidia repens]|uniref:RING-type domain-containing protein n=1 Tax=Absidia repens TaxID=90262 RepID=A0A1X2IVB9_9FUNG|nr:hypothetical protein BCR42DRAFT_403767 [Absidia repens]
MPMFRKFFSVLRKNKSQRLIDTGDTSDENDDGFLDTTPCPSPSSPLKPPPMLDSAFCASHISNNTEAEWADKLGRINLYGEKLSSDWYHSLDQLASMMDKVTSPFQNTNRVALHQTQRFIETYLDNWKSHRCQSEGDTNEKIQLANQQFSDQVDLKNCVIKIHHLEKDLYDYRYTMDDQLMGLWDSKQKDQAMETWKHHWQAYHRISNQMECKFKALLESCSPKPDEYTCAVCLSIFTEPVTLQQCLHTFCKSCVQNIYCTCQLTCCDSSCHDPANRPSNMVDDEDDLAIPKKKLSRQFSSTYKPRYRQLISSRKISTPPPPPSPPSSSPSPSPSVPRRRYSTLRAPLKRFSMAAVEEPRPPTPTTTLDTEKVTLRCDCPLSWSVPPAAQCPLCRQPFGPDDCRLAVALDNLIRFYFPRHDRVRQKYDARERQLNRRTSLSAAWRFLPQSSLPSVPLPPRRQSPNSNMTMISISNDLANITRRSFIV